MIEEKKDHSLVVIIVAVLAVMMCFVIGKYGLSLTDETAQSAIPRTPTSQQSSPSYYTTSQRQSYSSPQSKTVGLDEIQSLFDEENSSTPSDNLATVIVDEDEITPSPEPFVIDRAILNETSDNDSDYVFNGKIDWNKIIESESNLGPFVVNDTQTADFFARRGVYAMRTYLNNYGNLPDSFYAFFQADDFTRPGIENCMLYTKDSNRYEYRNFMYIVYDKLNHGRWVWVTPEGHHVSNSMPDLSNYEPIAWGGCETSEIANWPNLFTD